MSLLYRIAERPDNETLNRCLDRSSGESEWSNDTKGVSGLFQARVITETIE